MSRVVVVGAGPGGLACAVELAEAGSGSVMLVDEGMALGGQIWRRDVAAPKAPEPAARKTQWIARAKAQIEAGRLDYRARHVAVDGRAEPLSLDLQLLHAGGSPERVHADAIVLACGARERFLPFAGWTRPGVFGVGGLQALVKQGLPVAGKRVVLAGSGPLLLAVAADLRARGAELVALVEQTPRRAMIGLGAAAVGQRSKRVQAAELAARLVGVPRLWSSWPVEALGADARPDSPATALVVTDERGRERRLEADYFGCGFGLIPELRLAQALGCLRSPEPKSLDAGLQVDADQATSVPGIYAVGEQCGVAGVDVALLEGQVAAAAIRSAATTQLARRRDHERRFADRLARAYALRPELRRMLERDPARTLVCRCEDVSVAQVRAALSWAGADARSVKLHTRCGMGPCQGRVCEPALELLFDLPAARPRPPLIPLRLSTLPTNHHQTPSEHP